MADVQLITLGQDDEPYIKAAELAEWLEYSSEDGVSQLVRRRRDDFLSKETALSDSGDLLLNFEGALKVCMFCTQPKAREARDHVIAVYKGWRSGELHSYEKISPTQQALMLARAVANLAEEQLRQERTIERHDQAIENIDHRLKQIEAKQHNGFVSESQCAQITVKVREVGQLLSSSGKGMYGTVYTEMYQKFGVTSYKNIPADMFGEVMGWLNQKRSAAVKQLKE